MLNVDQANRNLKHQKPESIIQWLMTKTRSVICTSSFGPNSAALLHMVSQAEPELPIIWVDSGYHMRNTYEVAEEIIDQLNLNIRIYTPDITTGRLNARFGGVPSTTEPEQHREFTNLVKLEPFSRALQDIKPSAWITGIRQTDTDHRKKLDILSRDHRGILKVAPIFYWSDQQLQDYMDLHQLPSCKHYFDPTKVSDGRECGLHTAA